MPRPVGHEGDQVAIAAGIFITVEVRKNIAQVLHDLHVRALRVATNVVSLADTTVPEHLADRGAMITYVPAIAINWQRFAAHSVANHQRNQFFGKLVRAVIVRAVCDHHGQTICDEIGTAQMISGGFRRGIRTAGAVAAGFSECRVCRSKRSVNLISRNVDKAKRIGVKFRFFGILPDNLEQ